ncbi:MAG: XrtA system polysaccharide deacetylase [Candidatus Zixiibacteriota bacterium]
MLNLLTVDLEEWFVVEALSGRHEYDQWPELPSTVVGNSRRLLALFEHKRVQATWFVLGYVAEQHPELIQEIVDHGHEIACHSYRHCRVDKLSPEEFRQDTYRAANAIFGAVGFRPRGYRAPSWSMGPQSAWAFKVLAELGFAYDSSIFPIKHDIYGMPHGPREPFKMTFDDGLTLWEIPNSTFRIFGRNLPLAGGGYLRHSPYWYSRWMIHNLNKQKLPAMVYIHPWELDPEPPRVEGLSPVQRFRTYGSTAILARKVERLLSEFEFTTISDYLGTISRKRIGFE